MKCGTNRFYDMTIGNGSGATAIDAENAARRAANASARPIIADMNKFYNQDCPAECPNKTIHRPIVKGFEVYTTYNPFSGDYHAVFAYVFYGSYECD